MAISLTAFRQNLYAYVKQVLADETGSLTISSKGGEVELVNSAELRSLREFHHLFSSQANAERLLISLARIKRGESIELTATDLQKIQEGQ